MLDRLGRHQSFLAFHLDRELDFFPQFITIRPVEVNFLSFIVRNFLVHENCAYVSVHVLPLLFWYRHKFRNLLDELRPQFCFFFIDRPRSVHFLFILHTYRDGVVGYGSQGHRFHLFILLRLSLVNFFGNTLDESEIDLFLSRS